MKVKSLKLSWKSLKLSLEEVSLSPFTLVAAVVLGVATWIILSRGI
jgi:hypothetical protein